MAVPMVGADSRLDSDTVTTVPAEDTSFPASNLSDDRTFPVFKPTSAATVIDIITDAGVGNTVSVDYCMIVGHDLFDPANDGLGVVAFAFADSADNISYNTAQFATGAVDNKIILRTFATVTNRFFRLRLDRASAFIPSIGQLQWGVRVDLDGVEIGFDPQDEIVNAQINRSQTGNILGVVRTHSDRRANLFMPQVLNSLLRDTTSPGGFQDVWDNHVSLGKPFAFSWNPGNPGSFEKDAFFAILASRGISRPIITALDTGERDLEFSITGLKE